MAEESDLEKTEPASERRLEKAREEGNVARSRELTTLVMLGTALGGLWFTAESLGSTMSAALRRGLHFEPQVEHSVDARGGRLGKCNKHEHRDNHGEVRGCEREN